MSVFNAAVRGDFQRMLSDGRKQIIAMTREISGADTEPVRKAAAYLARTWREVISTKSTAPSAPGQPPHQITGRTRRSIRHGVVDGVRRVGSASFSLRMLAFGIKSSGGAATVSRRGKRKGQPRRSIKITIAPRPSATIALNRAAPKMVDVYVEAAQKIIERGG
jgi:hypothetical protein